MTKELQRVIVESDIERLKTQLESLQWRYEKKSQALDEINIDIKTTREEIETLKDMILE